MADQSHFRHPRYPLAPQISGFDRAALDALLSLGDQRLFSRGMVSSVGFPSVSLHYSANARTAGVSTYTWRRMTGFAIDAITGFSVGRCGSRSMAAASP